MSETAALHLQWAGRREHRERGVRKHVVVTLAECSGSHAWPRPTASDTSWDFVRNFSSWALIKNAKAEIQGVGLRNLVDFLI